MAELAEPATLAPAPEAVRGSVAAAGTTGIYCLPECSARPNPGNVHRFELAAAAEAAGYRACLRCRPYRRLPQIAWTSNPELLCRAVRMILAGALDDGTEADLGGQLGVSARHLRRLFADHLGVTPDGLARSARTHFARRLLDDTDLTIGEVAVAAGFGSVRQLNRACRQVFRLAPGELRARRRRNDRLVADGGLALRLRFEGALDWSAMLAALAATAIPGVEAVRDGTYRRTIVIDGDPGVLELGPADERHLLLIAHLPHWGELMHLIERARRIASCDFPLQEAHEQLAGDPLLGPLIRARPGLRPPGAWDGHEAGVGAIARQWLPARAADEAVARLARRFGRRVPGLEAMDLTHAFPDPGRLAEADPEAAGLPSACASDVRAFARAVRDEQVHLDGSMTLDQLTDAIGAACPAIATTTIHAIALRVGERDAWPLATDRLEITGDDYWRPWRALAATHLTLRGPSPTRGE